MRTIKLLEDDQHIPALVSLMNECQPHLGRDVNSTRTWFRVNQCRINIFGVFEDDKLIAYAATEPQGDAFLIGEGGVSKDYRSQGIAADTISFVSKFYWDRGKRIARILTQKHYIRQQLLYQRLGFSIQGYSKNRSDFPDCWMVKYLTEDNL